jgi:hypothetical protein
LLDVAGVSLDNRLSGVTRTALCSTSVINECGRAAACREGNEGLDWRPLEGGRLIDIASANRQSTGSYVRRWVERRYQLLARSRSTAAQAFEAQLPSAEGNQ